MESLSGLPLGVKVDSVELDPSLFTQVAVDQISRDLGGD